MKRRFVKDYAAAEGETKSFRYIGTYYVHRLEQTHRRKNGAFQLLAAVMEIMLLTGVCFFDSPGTYTPYVILPMVCMFFPAVYYILGTWAFMHCEQQMERYAYEGSFGRMMRAVYGACVLNLLALCGDVFLIVRNVRTWKEYSEYILLTVLVLLAVINYTAVVYHRHLMKQVWKEKNREQL